MLTPIYIASDGRVRWDRLKDARDETYANNATVAFSLTTAAGVAVHASATGVSMPYVPSSDGRYQGILPKTAADLLTDGTTYILTLTATRGGYSVTRKLACKARYQGAE